MRFVRNQEKTQLTRPIYRSTGPPHIPKWRSTVLGSGVLSVCFARPMAHTGLCRLPDVFPQGGVRRFAQGICGSVRSHQQEALAEGGFARHGIANGPEHSLSLLSLPLPDETGAGAGDSPDRRRPCRRVLDRPTAPPSHPSGAAIRGEFPLRRGTGRREPGAPADFAPGTSSQGQRSPRLKVIASKGGTHTGSSSFALAIGIHCRSRSSNASRVRSAGSTSHRCETPSRA